MIHLIILADDSDAYAYHFVTDDLELIKKKEQFILSSLKDSPIVLSPHILKTSDSSWAAVVKSDPYFADFKEYSSKTQFINKVEESSQLTDVEVADYLISKFSINKYPLQKVLYYAYADHLVINKKPLFSARFLAFDHGPVDYDVWKYSFKHNNPLNHSHIGMLQKISSNKKIQKYLDRAYDKYGSFFEDGNSFDDSSQNPTHNPGTPWSRAYAKGQNTVITDDDIQKYHYLEKID